jgi:hypothetical protein
MSLDSPAKSLEPHELAEYIRETKLIDGGMVKCAQCGKPLWISEGDIYIKGRGDVYCGSHVRGLLRHVKNMPAKQREARQRRFDAWHEANR